MATYRYHCLNKDCLNNKDNFDIVHSMANHPMKVCPLCNVGKLESVPIKNDGGVHYKGVGWFKTGGY
jgi:predicted nucleic acid-binding Zn ribbon protein